MSGTPPLVADPDSPGAGRRKKRWRRKEIKKKRLEIKREERKVKRERGEQ